MKKRNPNPKCRKCRCALGENNTFVNALLRGNLICKSCYGVYRKNRLIQARKNNDIEYLLVRRLSYTKQRAKNLDIPFNITLKYLISIIPECCPVFNVPFDWTGKNRKRSMSLDRIDPKKGYVEGNIQVISFRANIMKNDASPEELLAFADWVNSMYNMRILKKENTIGAGYG